MIDLHCLSLRQPWASLVTIGVKTIIDQPKATKYRGRIGIASTAERPIPATDRDLTVGAWTVTWGMEGFFMRDQGAWQAAVEKTYVPLPLGALVATANLVDCVPIVHASNKVERPGLFVHDYPGLVKGERRLWLCKRRENGDIDTIDRVEEQRPYGDFSPGRWAWLLDDVKATHLRCPACWGEGGFRIDEGHGNRPERTCPACDGKGACQPIPVKGHL